MLTTIRFFSLIWISWQQLRGRTTGLSYWSRHSPGTATITLTLRTKIGMQARINEIGAKYSKHTLVVTGRTDVKWKFYESYRKEFPW